MKQNQARALASHDAAWTDVVKHKQRLESILERGFEDESDVKIAREVITLVLAEIMYREAEALKMKIIRPIKPAESTKPKYADVLYAGEFITRIELSIADFGSRKLVQSDDHGFNGLSEFGVDFSNFQTRTVYECPWSGNHYHWMYPLGIVTDDEREYDGDGDAHKCRPWLCREIDQRNNMDFVNPMQWGKVVDAMLGHGYTTGTMPCDGSGEKVLATIPLDNGDELLVACWVWSNK